MKRFKAISLKCCFISCFMQFILRSYWKDIFDAPKECVIKTRHFIDRECHDLYYQVRSPDSVRTQKTLQFARLTRQHTLIRRMCFIRQHASSLRTSRICASLRSAPILVALHSLRQSPPSTSFPLPPATKPHVLAVGVREVVIDRGSSRWWCCV